MAHDAARRKQRGAGAQGLLDSASRRHAAGASCDGRGGSGEKFTGIVIGVTGSVGKTTTRQMIHTVLQSRLKGTASPRKFNNHWGVPLSMLTIEPQDDYAVLELGANRPDEIASLAELVRAEGRRDNTGWRYAP